MKVNKNMVSGNTAMLILKLISEKDMYGYEMIDTLSRRSDNVFELKVGTLYPLLHSMVQSGYLESYNQEANGKLRKYYRITPNGKNISGENDRRMECLCQCSYEHDPVFRIAQVRQ